MSRFDAVNDPQEVIQQALYAAEWHERRWCETQALPLDWATRPRVDRVGVLYASEHSSDADAFEDSAINEGWLPKGVSHQHVEGHLGQEDYDARTCLLVDPDNKEFFLEILTLIDGPHGSWSSPMHRALMTAHGQGAVGYASFLPRHFNADGDAEVDLTLAAYQAENTYLSAMYEVRECLVSDADNRYTYWALRDDDDMMQGYLQVRYQDEHKRAPRINGSLTSRFPS